MARICGASLAAESSIQSAEESLRNQARSVIIPSDVSYGQCPRGRLPSLTLRTRIVMGGFDHHAPAPASFDSPATSARNARVGMVLFVLYVSVYAGFVLLNAFWPAVMSDNQVGGVNLSVAYGLGLIVLAFVLALGYSWVCRAPVA